MRGVFIGTLPRFINRTRTSTLWPRPLTTTQQSNPRDHLDLNLVDGRWPLPWWSFAERRYYGLPWIELKIWPLCCRWKATACTTPWIRPGPWTSGRSTTSRTAWSPPSRTWWPLRPTPSRSWPSPLWGTDPSQTRSMWKSCLEVSVCVCVSVNVNVHQHH